MEAQQKDMLLILADIEGHDACRKIAILSSLLIMNMIIVRFVLRE